MRGGPARIATPSLNRDRLLARICVSVFPRQVSQSYLSQLDIPWLCAHNCDEIDIFLVMLTSLGFYTFLGMGRRSTFKASSKTCPRSVFRRV